MLKFFITVSKIFTPIGGLLSLALVIILLLGFRNLEEKVEEDLAGILQIITVGVVGYANRTFTKDENQSTSNQRVD